MTTHLDYIAETLSEIELADDTANHLYDHMNEFSRTRTWQHLMKTPGFAKLWDGIAEAVDRAGGFDQTRAGGVNRDLTP